jgi:hypothetical protein
MRSFSRDKEQVSENNEYYTGEKKKQLLVHVLQDGIEVTKPIKSKIYEQKVTWNKRQWFVYPERFVFDYKGVAHQYVDVNDVAVLTIHKDHTDRCKKCDRNMTIDAKQARELGKKGVFHAIWGIDSTHMILLIVFAIGAMAMAGFAVYSYNQDTLHKTQLDNANQKIAEYKIQLGIVDEEPKHEGTVTAGKPK